MQQDVSRSVSDGRRANSVDDVDGKASGDDGSKAAEADGSKAAKVDGSKVADADGSKAAEADSLSETMVGGRPSKLAQAIRAHEEKIAAERRAKEQKEISAAPSALPTDTKSSEIGTAVQADDHTNTVAITPGKEVKKNHAHTRACKRSHTHTRARKHWWMHRWMPLGCAAREFQADRADPCR